MYNWLEGWLVVVLRYFINPRQMQRPSCWLVLVMSLSCLHGYTISEVDMAAGHDVLKQVAIDPYTHHKVPVLKMFKRQIKNFRTGRKHGEASLTLVYTANEPVVTHWFEIITDNGQEIAYPILPGHPEYTLSSLHSGDVTASTIVIPVRHHDKNHEFETIITNTNGTMQYQLKTVLKKKIVYRLDDIDSPEWLVVPPTESHLHGKQTFQRHCRAFARLGPSGNTLNLIHAYYDNIPGDRRNGGPDKEMRFRRFVTTHDWGNQELNEEEGDLIKTGRLHRLTYATKRDAGVFDVKANKPNAVMSNEGIYLCTLERRKQDKLNFLSFVTVGRHRNLSKMLPSKATVELATCATNNYKINSTVIVWNEKSLGCLRCRSYGHPKPTVEIRKKYGNRGSQSESLLTDPNIGVTMFTNVEEAGIVEAFYVFRHVNRNTAGQYVCSSENDNGGGNIFFDIKIRSRRY